MSSLLTGLSPTGLSPSNSPIPSNEAASKIGPGTDFDKALSDNRRLSEQRSVLSEAQRQANK